ncbi:hypothetical protein BH10PSE15_BH10PSE15_02590 [soil metagenome]
MEEMAANIKQNADNAAQTEKIVRQSSDAPMTGVAQAAPVTPRRLVAPVVRNSAPSFKAKPKVKAKPDSIADQRARVKGFALDLATGGPDADDADFGQAARARRDRPPSAIGYAREFPFE